MRPILLDLDGFASYRTKSTVDFRGADFFVLVGPTGAGKSTVIDALVFALYGTVPRYGDRSAVAPALAPTANRGVVRLIFDVGGERYSAIRDIRRGGGKAQPVTVKEARLEQYLSPDATGLPEDATNPLASGAPSVTKAVEKLLGLTFEQFTQSVALPQGEFARFLHATDGERQAILKNLLGYGIYDDIHRAANSRANDNKLRADTLAEQLTGYDNASQAQLDAHAAAVARLIDLKTYVTTVGVPALQKAAAEAAAARTQFEQLVVERAEFLAVVVPDDIAELTAEQQAKKTALATSTSEQMRAEDHDNQARADLAAAPPRHEVEQKQQHWIEHDRISAELPTLIRAAAEAATGLQAATDARQIAEAALVKAQAAASEAERLAELHQRTVAATQAQIDALNTLAAPEGLDLITQAIRDARSQLEEATAALRSAESTQQHAVDHLDALPAPAALTYAASQAEQLNQILADDLAAAAQRAEAASQADSARTQAARAADALATAQAALRHAEQDDKAAAIRAELHVGDHCPVCGHTIAELSHASNDGDITAALTAVRLATDAATEAAAVSANLDAQLASDLADRRRQLRRCEDLREQLVASLVTIGMDEQAASLNHVVDENATSASLSGLSTIATAIHGALVAAQGVRSDAEESRRAADASVAANRATIRNLETASKNADDQAFAARTALGAARDRVAALAPPTIDDDDIHAGWDQLIDWARSQSEALATDLTASSTTADKAAVEAQRLQTELKHADTKAVAAREQFTAAALANQSADERARSARQRLDELTGLLSESPALEEVRAQLEHVIALQEKVQSAGLVLNDARAATKTAEEALAEVDAAVELRWQQLHRTRDPLTRFGAPEITGTDLAAAWRIVADWCVVEAAARQAQSEAAEQLAADADRRALRAEQELTDALSTHEISVPPQLTGPALATEAPTLVASEVATASAAMQRAQERLREAEKVQAQMQTAAEEAAVAKKLASLMKSDQFPRWLIASALDTLLEDASKILFELSGGQFELTRDQRDLLVIDHNDADMCRLVKTLSGGETFQASLALALALSEQVTSLSAAGASKLESIFLDEGFGTLDDATLDVVAGTLENLAASGSRMVGVITHVGALAERIPVRFRVTRDGSGSHIEREQL